MASDFYSSAFVPIPELRWLFFDLNSYFASVEQQENPALRGQPVAVVPMLTDSTCAIAASYEAKAYGIKAGTKIYDAKKKCPNLKCVLARHDLYVDYHHRILAELERHLHVTKVCSIDEAACLLFKNDRLPDKAHQLALQIKRGFKKNVGEAVTCSIGIAPNAYLAKIGTEIEKPNGLVILKPGQYQEQLFTLGLRDLPGINTRMERRLQNAGVYSVEQFWELAPKQARKIWGNVEGERLWFRLHGYEVPEEQTQKRMIGHSRVLDPALRTPAKAYGISRQLTLKAASRLRRYHLYGQRFSLSVRNIDGMGWSAEYPLRATQDNFVFVKALAALWEQMVFDLQNTNLLNVSVSIYELCEHEQITADLFDQTNLQETNKNRSLTTTMDHINRRFGAGTIQIGTCPSTLSGYVGTKIAFNRIPEQAEFDE